MGSIGLMAALTVHPILVPGAIVVVLLRLMGFKNEHDRNDRNRPFFEQNQRRACCTITPSVSSLSRPDRAQPKALTQGNIAKKE